tara:strand:- start:1327 stop:1515 length:189 start_codon:yes stop_codon:yes gene_type:complete
MKVKMLKNCYVDSKAVKKGDVVDTKQAWLLIGSGKATKDFREVKPKAKKSPANRQIDDAETR